MNADLRDYLAELRSRLATAGANTGLPGELEAAVRQVGSGDALVQRFVAAAETAGAQAVVASAESWVGVCVAWMREREVRCAVLAPETLPDSLRAAAAALAAAVGAAGVALREAWDDETMFSADVGITGVRAAVAETGSLVCASGAQAPRGASLIPPRHLAIVAASQVVADVFDVYGPNGALAAEMRGDLPSNVNLITGPSKTADIEGVLVTGVHGPGEVRIVIVEGV